MEIGTNKIMTDKSLNLCFKALSSETRRKIIFLLMDKSLCAGEIAEQFNLTGATISHHLKILSASNLLNRSRKGLSIYYSLNMREWNSLKKWFNSIN